MSPAVLRLSGCLAVLVTSVSAAAQTPGAAATHPATAADAEAFIARAESVLAVLAVKQERTDWVASTYITYDTEVLTAEAQAAYSGAVRDLALEARRFAATPMSAVTRRKFALLRLALAAPPPSDPLEAVELTRLKSGMKAEYGRGTWCRAPDACLQITDIERILASSHDPAELAAAWQGWHRIAVPMRDRYTRFVALSNAGARALGFADAGAMWRAGYDMPADSLTAEVNRLWEQLRPLYEQLHAYVRARLVARYGAAVVPPDGLIPGHLLGNLWAQEWSNIYDLVAPSGVPAGVDLTALLRARGLDERGMVRAGERFYVSLGFDSLPVTFWERSQFTKPRDRDVVCHASAWDLDGADDLRIKMCIQVTASDFVTIHHELGHNFYQRAYAGQPFLFQGGANDGFHEAIGDAVALSVTPRYLLRIGLLDTIPSAASDTAALLRIALDKIAFLPFGLALDGWRWGVFAGTITPDRYNAAWWDLKHRYQGVAEPVARSEQDFDPGAKYHVAANVPYLRYFIAHVLQFQFHRAWCRAAGWTGPLYQCSVFGSAAAGAGLARMLQAGQSRPWQEILFAATGDRQMDATALVEYFQPLLVWLERQNRGVPVGW